MQLTVYRLDAPGRASLASLLLLIALLLGPVYLWASGLPQPAHLVAALACLMLCLERRVLDWSSATLAGWLFVAWALLVGSLAYLAHGELPALLAPLYYAFGLALFVAITTTARDEGRVFLVWVFRIQVVLLIALVVFTLAGAGRLYAARRAMGLFNDPNQMANWILWVAVSSACLGRALYGSWRPGALLMLPALIGVVLAASRSGALGLLVAMLVFVAMGVVLLARLLTLRRGLAAGTWALLPLLLVVAGLAGPALLAGLADTAGGLVQAVTFLAGRFDGLGATLLVHLEGRGYDRLWKFPGYLLFGASEGATWRFAGRARFLGEIHSTWAGVLFTYGLVGASLLFAFLYGLWRRLRDAWFRLLLLAPLAYGFSTYNLRNWYFWVGLALIVAAWDLLERERAERRLVALAATSLVADTER